MTQDEIAKIIKRRLIGVYMRSFTISDVIDVLSTAGAAQQTAFMSAIVNETDEKAIQGLRNALKARATTLATAETDQIIASGNINLETLGRFIER